MTWGFFGGTFDPIHKGHIYLAKQALNEVEHILFCPAHSSPFKMDCPPVASGEDRLQMVRLAIEGEPRFSVTDCELRRPPPSYTIDTIRFLMETLHKNFRLILSADEVAGLSHWKEVDDLVKLAPPLIGPRTPVKSRDLRKQLCPSEMDEKVLAYILEHQLYSVHHE